MTDYELETLLFYSFRYAIGRMTYVVGDICDLLIKHKDKLSKMTKELIIKDILTALHRDMAGMEWDREQWEILVYKLQQ